MKSCGECIYKARLWGLWYCLLDQWSGINNEKWCFHYRVSDERKSQRRRKAVRWNDGFGG